MGGTKWPALLGGSLTYRPLATLAMLVMFVICTVFLVPSVMRFIKMRRA